MNTGMHGVRDTVETLGVAYGAEYRGVAGYYLLANDVWRLGALRWDVETSMLKTLAAKHKSSVAKTVAKYKAEVGTCP